MSQKENCFVNQKSYTGELSDGIRLVGKGSWKKREVGKPELKLERLKFETSGRSWKGRSEVGKIQRKLESSS